LNKKITSWKSFFGGVVPWFIPQILLEIKNKFQMSKLLIGIFTGGNNVLGDKMSFVEVITSHIKVIRGFFEGQFIAPYGLGLVVLILAIVLILINKKYRKIGIYFLSFLIFAFVFYTTIYHHELKVWYLESLRIWYCFVFGIGLVNIKKFKKYIALIVGRYLERKENNERI
jgi:hypothetical protein